jgi:hypothetical protein
MAVSNITRFVPLDGIPDADVRGIGTFLFDDGRTEVTEDKELADLVKSYQDELPQLQAMQQQMDSQPDLRTARMGDLPGKAARVDFIGKAAAAKANPLTSGGTPLQDLKGALPDVGAGAGFAPALDPNAPKPAPPSSEIPDPATVLGAGPESMQAAMPAEPTDAQQAIELHRIAAQQALRGGYVAPQKAGWSPAQRTGAMPADMTARHADARDAALESVISTASQQASDEALLVRQSTAVELGKLEGQRQAQEKTQQDAQFRRNRLLEDRRKINDAKIDARFAQGDVAANVFAVLGAALLGAIGSDAGLKAIENRIDRDVRKQLSVRGSQLEALASEIGSEEEVIAAAKAKYWEIVEKESQVSKRFMDAAGIEHKADMFIQLARQRAIDENQNQERENLGKTTEVYQQARAGGRTGPDLNAAAKHFEAANKLGEKPKADTDRAQATAELKRLRDNLVRGRQSGDLAKVVGMIDQPVSAAQRKVGTLSPGQLEQMTTLEELQVGNLMRLVREPNNKRTQDMVQQIGNPQSDAEIDVAISRINQLIAAEEQGGGESLQPTQVR